MLTDFIKSRINQGISSCKTPMRCSAVEINKDHLIVTINGGNNGYSDFNQYLTDIKTIINYFDKDMNNFKLIPLNKYTTDYEQSHFRYKNNFNYCK